MSIFKKLLGLCDHRWLLVENKDIAVYDEECSVDKPIYHKWIKIYECEKCHKMKKTMIKY